MNQRFDSTSMFFGALLFLASAYFLHWGLEYTGRSSALIFVLATMFGLFMAFNIGGNDVANSFGTSVGAGTLTMKQALTLAVLAD